MTLLLTSCEKDYDISENPQPNKSLAARGKIDDPKGELVILGKHLQNAYSVTTMQNAFDYYNSLYSTSPYKDRVVKATHKYIKIIPTTEDDLIRLDKIADKNNAIVLSQYPLDYEVLQEGSDYIDSTYTGKIEYKPAYTVIPIDSEFEVPYVVLDKLYEPKDEEFDVETIALAMSDWQDDLIADFGQEVTMINVTSFIDGPNVTNRLFGHKFTPSGFIRMHIYDTGGNEGLQFANLQTGRAVWWSATFTNDQGMFIATKSYRGKVRIRSTWRNFTATLRMTWYEMIGFQVSDHVMTETASNNWRVYEIFNAAEDQDIWCKGAVHNGTIKYFQYCYLNGIIPVFDANIWVWKKGDGSGSTPMLKKYPAMLTMATINGWTQSELWSSLLLHIATDVYQGIATVLPHLMPDQTYKGINQRYGQSNRSVEQLVFHESGHFSHALKCGSWNYSHIVAAEIKNIIDHGSEPYYDGQSPTTVAGRQIALAEGWATFTENKCMQTFYGYSIDAVGVHFHPGYIENYTMYSTPFNNNAIIISDNNSWFLTGLFWDISDNQIDDFNAALPSSFRDGNTNALLANIHDDFFIGNSAGLIYNHLTSNVYNGNDLRNSLVATYPTQAVNINLLFRTYGQYY